MPAPARASRKTALAGANALRWCGPRAAALALTAVTIVVYANSFSGALLFDDQLTIRSPAVQHLWPPDWLSAQRPVLLLSLALNQTVGAGSLWGYHLVNLGIHLIAGLLLFGIVRRAALRVGAGTNATGFAFCVALLWLVHPLQTQSVTYVIQRSESLMGMYYLLTLYAALRAHSGGTRGSSAAWVITAALACALAMASKPVAVTAPLIIVLFDRAFLFGDWRSAWRARWPLYAGLLATWAVLPAIGLAQGLFAAPGDRPANVGFQVPGLGPWAYLCTQAEVIVHYLRLAVWPDVLVLDYGWPIAAGVGAVRLPGLLVIGLLVVTLAVWRIRRWWGICGLWFFIILSPTSSFVPVRDAAFEHRMYLPLAGVIVVVLAIGLGCLRRLVRRSPAMRFTGVVAVAVAACALSARTIARNRDYHNPVTLWQKNASARPQNPRAYNNLCQALNDAGRNDEALSACDRALQLKPDYADALNNRGNVLLGLGRNAEAADACRHALALKPDFADAHVTLGYALLLVGDLDGAVDHERAALALEPDNVQALNNLGNALARQGAYADAKAAFARALKLAPQRADTYNNLGWLCAARGDLEGAARNFEQAAALAPDLLPARINLAQIYSRMGRTSDARDVLTEAMSVAQTQGAEDDVELIRSRLAALNPPTR